MDAGASLTDCPNHNSALFCATDRYKKGLPLKAEVIKLLIQSGACVDERSLDGCTPVMCALQYCKYEIEAVELLLGGLRWSDPNDRSGYLRAAMSNSHCNVTVVKLLIKHGVQVNVEKHSDISSALHLAIKQWQDLSVIKSLLDNGAEMNHVNSEGETPLMLAFRLSHYKYYDDILAELLLSEGAVINFRACCCLMRLLNENVLYHDVNVSYSCVKLLLRYFFLQSSWFNIELWFEDSHYTKQPHPQPSAVLKLRDDCKNELQNMKTKQIGENFTLYEFLSEYATPRGDPSFCGSPGKTYNFDKLLKALRDNAYPLYFHTISAKVGRSSMTRMPDEVQVYTVRSVKNPCVKNKIVLNHDSVCHISRFLAGDDLLRFILAFYDPHGKSCSGKASNQKKSNYLRMAECAIHYN